MKVKLNMWKEIWKLAGVNEMETNDELSLDGLVQNHLLEHRSIIEDVSRKAEKQW